MKVVTIEVTMNVPDNHDIESIAQTIENVFPADDYGWEMLEAVPTGECVIGEEDK